MDFTARKIIHPLLNNTEIYLVSFQSQEMIDQFLKKSPWFDKDDAVIGQRFVIEYHPEQNYYEKFELTFFKKHIQDLNNVYAQIYNELINFFQQN